MRKSVGATWGKVSAAVVIGLATIEFVVAQELKPTTLKPIGPWSIYRSVDAMTDKVSCTAVHADGFNVQYGQGVLIIAMRGRGGIASYRYRVDDGAATPANIVSIRDSVASNYLAFGPGKIPLPADAKRLRIEIFTVTRDVKNFDIDLSTQADLDKALAQPPCI